MTKKATKSLSSEDAGCPTVLALQGDEKVNGFLTKPIPPLWVDTADRRHRLPDMLLKPRGSLPFSFLVSFKDTHTHAKGTPLKL